MEDECICVTIGGADDREEESGAKEEAAEEV